MEFESQEFTPNYHHFKIEGQYTDWQYHFVASDIHLDNPKCNREKLKEDLDHAVSIGATISITGDLLCLMQGKYDKRASKHSLRKQYVEGGPYFDNVIKDAVNFLSPYAKNIILISKGNHETAIEKNIEVDILKWLVRELNIKNNTKIQLGEYRGYFTIDYVFHGRHHAVNFGYTHGNFGGNITKGALSVVRNSALMPDCDIMFSGHTHDSWVIPQPFFRRNNQKKRVEIKNQYHIRTGTYKEEFKNGRGWAVEKVAFPKVIGGCLCKFKFSQHKDAKMRFELTSD